MGEIIDNLNIDELSDTNAALRTQVTKQYPTVMSQLDYTARIVAEGLRVFENSTSKNKSLDVTVGKESADASYATLGKLLSDFIFDCNKPDIIAAQAHLASHADFTEEQKIFGMNFAVNQEQQELTNVSRQLKRGSAFGTDIATTLYDENQPLHKNFLSQPEDRRAAMAVVFNLAAKLDRDRLAAPGFQALFQDATVRGGVSTPWGNPVDVSQSMLNKAGFFPKK